MVERLNPEDILVLGGNEDDAKRFIESDFKRRSGLCPNNCGLLQPCSYGQECPKCGFSCNTMPDKELMH